MEEMTLRIRGESKEEVLIFSECFHTLFSWVFKGFLLTTILIILQ